ncbi:MAG: hypothetical protein HY985_16050 [Magnetospirillum sp.]|nr:hypothetical protein [Magnetospirillum sp.]
MGRDDVIRIRVDMARAVTDFLDLLARQAAEGETRAPAKPANRAFYRELAPFLLEEYTYIAPEVGGVIGVYVGLADGSLYAAGEEIPEAVVDALVADGKPAPAYIYVLLAQPAESTVIDTFLSRLVAHIGVPLIGVYAGHDGAMTAVSCCTDAAELLRPDIAVALSEVERHLTRGEILALYESRSRRPDGRAYARLTYDYDRHVVEFASAADRDDFIRWSERLCEWAFARGWAELGFATAYRPAEVAAVPPGDVAAVALTAPSSWQGGRPWQAFAESEPQAAEIVHAYWDRVIETIAEGERAR